MSKSEICNVGFKSYHLDGLVQETTSILISNLDEIYSIGQFKFLKLFNGLTYDQILVKAILNNIDNILSVIIADPKYHNSEHKKGFVGKISDLDCEKNILLIYDESNHYFNIKPEEIEFINFKEQDKDKKIRSYIKSNKLHCLHCDAINSSEFGELSLCNGNVFQYVSCKECKKDWVCEYALHTAHINS